MLRCCRVRNHERCCLKLYSGFDRFAFEQNPDTKLCSQKDGEAHPHTWFRIMAGADKLWK